MATIFNILIISVNLMFNGYSYWENFSEQEKETILKSKVINDNVRIIIFNDFVEINETLLDVLVAPIENDSIKALYFYAFNKISLKADGETSEILGKYCQLIILSDIPYVLSYLEDHPPLLDIYTELMGYEFAMKEEGLSDTKYKFEDFKSLINKAYKERKKESFLKLFYDKINNSLENARD